MNRLLPSPYSHGGTVWAEVADNDDMLQDLILLESATNDRVQGEQNGLSGISTYELVYGIPNAHIVNAAFTHASEVGARFNDHTRGAWYAAEELETSLAEVTYHKARRLSEIVVPELPDARPDREASTYDDWLADFRAAFHVLSPPVPQCYAASQQMAGQLLNQQSNGIIYPSVRRRGSQCLVCFRPALIYNPRRSTQLEISFTASKSGYQHAVRFVPIN